MKRHLIETIERRKEMMIAALWANSGFSEGENGANARRSAIEELEENFQEAIENILSGKTEEEEEIDTDNPFFAAAERSKEKIQQPVEVNGTVHEALASGNSEIDQ